MALCGLIQEDQEGRRDPGTITVVAAWGTALGHGPQPPQPERRSQVCGHRSAT